MVSRCGNHHVRLGEVVLIKEWHYIPPSRQSCSRSNTITYGNVCMVLIIYVAKRSDGYLEVMAMERVTSDVDSTALPNLLPGDIYSVSSLKDSIRYVI